MLGGELGESGRLGRGVAGGHNGNVLEDGFLEILTFSPDALAFALSPDLFTPSRDLLHTAGTAIGRPR